MANDRKKQNSRRRGNAARGKGLPVLGIALLAVIALAVMIFLIATGEKDEAPGHAEGESGNANLSALTFPYTLPEDGLEINALFSSDIMNPDGGNVSVERLASLEVTNTSGRYLTDAVFTVTLTDGTGCRFRVNDLPAGGRAVAFSTDSAAYDGAGCAAIAVEAEFADGSQLMEGSVSVSVDGTAVTLTNLTGDGLGPLTVICHDTLDGSEFFGGVSYAYRTAAIPAGGSVTVEASDCVIGQPAVVRISGDG